MKELNYQHEIRKRELNYFKYAHMRVFVKRLAMRFSSSSKFAYLPYIRQCMEHCLYGTLPNRLLL